MRTWMSIKWTRCVWEGRARAGGESEQGGGEAVQSAVCVRVAGAQQAWQGGGCKRSRAVHTSMGVRGFMGMEAVS